MTSDFLPRPFLTHLSQNETIFAFSLLSLNDFRVNKENNRFSLFNIQGPGQVFDILKSSPFIFTVNTRVRGMFWGHLELNPSLLFPTKGLF